jgi:hypothetical protein
MVGPPPRLVAELGVIMVAAGAVFVPREAADPAVIVSRDEPGHASELSPNVHETVMSNTSRGLPPYRLVSLTSRRTVEPSLVPEPSPFALCGSGQRSRNIPCCRSPDCHWLQKSPSRPTSLRAPTASRCKPPSKRPAQHPTTTRPRRSNYCFVSQGCPSFSPRHGGARVT